MIYFFLLIYLLLPGNNIRYLQFQHFYGVGEQIPIIANKYYQCYFSLLLLWELLGFLELSKVWTVSCSLRRGDEPKFHPA